MINNMLYSTSHTEYKPNWSGGDQCLFSAVGQTQPLRLENRFIPGGIEKLAFNLPVGNVLVTSRVAETFQKALYSTDEINELARGRRGSKQAKSPPLHLYTILKQCLAIVLLVIDSDQNACKTVIAFWIAEDAQVDLFIDATSDIEIRKFAKSMGISPLLVPGKFRLHRMSEKTMYNLGIRSLPHVVTGTESIQ